MIRVERRKRWRTAPELAPLIDCMLLLLIFFLLTSSYSRSVAVSVELPKLSRGGTAEHSAVVVEILAEGAYQVKGRKINAQALADAVWAEASQIVPADPCAAKILICADKRTRIEFLTDALDVLMRKGLKNITLVGEKRAARKGEEQ